MLLISNAWYDLAIDYRASGLVRWPVSPVWTAIAERLFLSRKQTIALHNVIS